MTTKLKMKPCPFCGDKRVPKVEEDPLAFGGGDPMMYVTECRGCMAQGPVSHTREAAKLSWNWRDAEEKRDQVSRNP